MPKLHLKIFGQFFWRMTTEQKKKSTVAKVSQLRVPLSFFFRGQLITHEVSPGEPQVRERWG